MVPWYVLRYDLYKSERGELAKAFPELIPCECLRAKGVIGLHGTLAFARGSERQLVHVLLRYPNEFPYLPPEVVPLAHEVTDPHDEGAFVPRFFSERHQMVNGALCVFERPSAAGRHRHISGTDAMCRADRWLREILDGCLSPELDSAQADLEAHYERAGDILLGPSLFRDDLPDRGTLRAFPIRPSVKNQVPPLYMVVDVELRDGTTATDKDLLDRVCPGLEHATGLSGFDTRWHTLKVEPRPLRHLEHLARLLFPEAGDAAIEQFERDYARDRLTRPSIDIALRFPARVGTGWEWLFFRAPLHRDTSQPRAKVLGVGAAMILDFGSAASSWRDSKLTVLRSHDLRLQTFFIRNRNRVPKPSAGMSFAVLGTGALGSACADLLGKSGIRELRLFDIGLLDAGNVIRHVAPLRFVGLPKVAAVATAVAMHNPHCEIHANGQSALEAISPSGGLSSVSAVVSAIADDSVELALNQRAVLAGVTVYYLRALRSGTAARMIRVRPRVDACLECHARYLKDGHVDTISIEAAPDEVITHECGQAILAASAADIAVVAGMGIRLLLFDSAEYGETNQWAWTTTGAPGNPGLEKPFSMQQSKLPPHPNCIVCRDPRVRKLCVPDDVRAQLIGAAELASPNETGGILVGFRVGDTVTVVAASDAGPNAVCTPEKFERDGPHCQRFLERIVSERGGGLDYVGEWHSHPRSSSQPSLRDVESLLSISKDPAYLTDHPVMVIVAFPRGLGAGTELGATCHPKSGLVNRLVLESGQSFESGTERGTPPERS